ncbi:MAG: tetraacyldisaccharide 4'-kinase [Alphaproteobacteria bacterium]
MRAPDFWRRDGLAPALLAPLAWGFAAAGRARRAFARPARAPCPVVCVGNLVVGGAGKTPATLALARRLKEAGHNVHLLGRGYGGRRRGPLRVDHARHDAREVGDEALLLAAEAPTWVARDRVAGARAAAQAGAEVVVMDDGFQYPGLEKDLSLLVVDARYGFGNGRVMPAGPLRETLADGLARAQALVLVGDDGHGLKPRLEELKPSVLGAHLEPGPEAAALGGKRVLAFAGIARPGKFFHTLETLGCRVAAARAFPDHHRYDPDEIMTMVEDAHRLDAVPVTTEKDAVNLPPEARPMVKVVPVHLVFNEPQAVDVLLAPLLEGG